MLDIPVAVCSLVFQAHMMKDMIEGFYGPLACAVSEAKVHISHKYYVGFIILLNKQGKCQNLNFWKLQQLRKFLEEIAVSLLKWVTSHV